MNNSDAGREFSSFRDPSGQVFTKDGILYRQINRSYLPQYTKLMESGLYEELQKFKAMVSHEETALSGNTPESALVVCPQKIPYISYPYEWVFGQMKDAALLTLRLHRRAMTHDMALKDASAYNIQFMNGRPILIDTLSFDFYKQGEPWGAYGQFCRHFLAPLLLMCEVDLRLNRLMALYIDGVPLDLASKLLRGKGGFFAQQHIHWHAKSIEKHTQDGKGQDARAHTAVHLSKEKHLALIESLIRGIEGLQLKNVQTEWGDYYAHTNYTEQAANSKALTVSEMLRQTQAKSVWDLGANDGTYSRLALEQGASVVAFDIDPIAVERNYHDANAGALNMLPLVLDLTNPSAGIGFANRERTTIGQRQKPDCMMALALIHHLAISNNLPFDMIAQWFASLGHYCIVEFVPKEDSQVQLLLSTRNDIFPDYTQETFEQVFSQYFTLHSKKAVVGSARNIYLFEVKKRG